MSNDGDYLTISSSNSQPVTTTNVRLFEDEAGGLGSMYYWARFPELPECFSGNQPGGGYVIRPGSISGLSIEGRVEGFRFQVVLPRVLYYVDNSGVQVLVYPWEQAYERFGRLESHSDGTWKRLSTDGVANHEHVVRANPQIDLRPLSDIARSRVNNMWAPHSMDGDTSPHRDLVHLISVLPRSVSEESISELAASYLDVDKEVVELAVPDIRKRLRTGELQGPPDPDLRATIWYYEE